MGKRSRGREKKTWVEDASVLMTAVAGLVRSSPARSASAEVLALHELLGRIVDVWSQQPVVLRADADFLAALTASDADVDLNPDWLTRCRLGSFAVSFVEPLRLAGRDGPLDYLGWICVGASGFLDKGHGEAEIGPRIQIPDADGLLCLWIYLDNGIPTTHASQVFLTGPLAIPAARTLADLIASPGSNDTLSSEQVERLLTLGLLVPLYLAVPEPDLDWLPDERVARPQQLERAQVANLGWRVGADLRADTQHRAATGLAAGRGGWTVAPHVRSGHLKRVRVAQRDTTGAITGDVQGEQGIDWHYELRRIPAVRVNASEDLIPPAIRKLHRN